MKNYYPTISIITPSYNMLSYLKCCHASIIDQGIDVEHIVVDGGSTDRTVDWLKSQKDIIWISEKDNGMYDAINKGLKLARGEIIAYLNCDEQYLPGTLNFVKNYFEKNPTVDIIFGDFLIVDATGELICYRKAIQPRRIYILSDYLYVFTCTMFFRRKIVDYGIYFDNSLKDVGDSDFVLNVLKNGYRAKHIKKYFSIFTMTGNNKFLKENASSEAKKILKNYKYLIPFKYILRIARLTEKFVNGAYFQRFPLIYEIYVDNDLSKRKEFISSSGTFRLSIRKNRKNS